MSELKVTGEQLMQIAYQRRISSWTAFECPVCEYPIKYVFSAEYPQVRHDPGCYCTEDVHRQRYESSSWDLVADYINKTTDLELVKKNRIFWNL